MRIFLSIFFLSLMAVAAAASDKVALVIGNSDYDANYDLANPGNDARDIATALERHGFDVTTALDMGRDEMVGTLRGFRAKADAADIAMVYYSGHGMEFNGENYLIPVDAVLSDSRDIPETTVSLGTVLRHISGAAKLKMVVLDACRNNPFAASMVSPSGKKFVNQGLAPPVWQGNNTLIAYAAAAGAVTPDGLPGGNSPYTASFLEALAGPPRDVGIFMRSVGAGMRKRTGSVSLPFVYSSIPPEELIINSGGTGGAVQQASLGSESRGEAEPVETEETKRELARAIQAELNRLQCGPLVVDGDFGRRSRAALARYYEHSGSGSALSEPTRALLNELTAREAGICPKVASTSRRTTGNATSTTTTTVSKPDPVAYSYKVWAGGTVPYRQRVTANTSYGRLTCLGGRGTTIARKCSWQ